MAQELYGKISLVGLLATIKCSTCSYQFGMWLSPPSEDNVLHGFGEQGVGIDACPIPSTYHLSTWNCSTSRISVPPRIRIVANSTFVFLSFSSRFASSLRLLFCGACLRGRCCFSRAFPRGFAQPPLTLLWAERSGMFSPHLLASREGLAAGGWLSLLWIWCWVSWFLTKGLVSVFIITTLLRGCRRSKDSLG